MVSLHYFLLVLGRFFLRDSAKDDVLQYERTKLQTSLVLYSSIHSDLTL